MSVCLNIQKTEKTWDLEANGALTLDFSFFFVEVCGSTLLWVCEKNVVGGVEKNVVGGVGKNKSRRQIATTTLEALMQHHYQWKYQPI